MTPLGNLYFGISPTTTTTVQRSLCPTVGYLSLPLPLDKGPRLMRGPRAEGSSKMYFSTSCACCTPWQRRSPGQLSSTHRPDTCRALAHTTILWWLLGGLSLTLHPCRLRHTPAAGLHPKEQAGSAQLGLSLVPCCPTAFVPWPHLDATFSSRLPPDQQQPCGCRPMWAVGKSWCLVHSNEHCRKPQSPSSPQGPAGKEKAQGVLPRKAAQGSEKGCGMIHAGRALSAPGSIPTSPQLQVAVTLSATIEQGRAGREGAGSILVGATAIGDLPPLSSGQKQLDCRLMSHNPCTVAGVTRNCTQGSPDYMCMGAHVYVCVWCPPDHNTLGSHPSCLPLRAALIPVYISDHG